MAFKYTVADPAQNCGLTFDFGLGAGAEPIRLIHHTESNSLFQLNVLRGGGWVEPFEYEQSDFRAAHSTKDGILTIEAHVLDIDLMFDLPDWASPIAQRIDAKERGLVDGNIILLGGNIEHLEIAARRLWAGMSGPEREQLIYTREGLSILGLGGLSKLGSFTLEDFEPWSLEWQELGLDHRDLGIWLRSARQHAANTGEVMHQVGVMENLLRSMAKVIGYYRFKECMELFYISEQG